MLRRQEDVVPGLRYAAERERLELTKCPEILDDVGRHWHDSAAPALRDLGPDRHRAFGLVQIGPAERRRLAIPKARDDQDGRGETDRHIPIRFILPRPYFRLR